MGAVDGGGGGGGGIGGNGGGESAASLVQAPRTRPAIATRVALRIFNGSSLPLSPATPVRPLAPRRCRRSSLTSTRSDFTQSASLDATGKRPFDGRSKAPDAP